MAISKMKKFDLAVASALSDELIRELMWEGQVEIEDISEDFDSDPDFSRRDLTTQTDIARERCTEIDKALSVLKSYDVRKTGLFSKKADFKKNDCDAHGCAVVDSAVESADRVLSLKAEADSLKGAIQDIGNSESALEPWRTYPEPLCGRVTENLSVIFASVSSSVDDDMIDAALCSTPEGTMENKGVFFEVIDEAKGKYGRRYIAVFFLKELKAQVTAALLGAGFTEIDFSPFEGSDFKTAVQLLSELHKRKDALESELEKKESGLRALCENIDDMQLAVDILLTEERRLSAGAQSVAGGHVSIISGWVPEKCADDFSRIVEGFGCAYELSDPDSEDDVPILLDNNRFSKPFESVIEMYSMPSYSGFDPTTIMSVFYFVIFGFMLADVVYGLIVFIACMIALRKLSVRGTGRKLIAMFGICGVSCMAAGVLLSGYLGNLPSQIVSAATGRDFTMPGLDVLSTNGIIIFIIIALAIGLVQIITGMGINIYMLCRRGEYFSAVFDVGSWYVIFAGIALLALSAGTISVVVLSVGLLMKVCTGGRKKKGIFGKIFGGILGLYDIVGYASDAVSYVRIMALGLSSTVIALVVNIMATLLITPGFSVKSLIGWLVMPVILLFGHLLNLALNLLGCFVHDGRLQYIEFFGKFYEDGGRQFELLAPVTKYTVAVTGEGRART